MSSLTRILNLFSRDTYVAYTTHRYLAHICDSYVVDQILVRVSESTWGGLSTNAARANDQVIQSLFRTAAVCVSIVVVIGYSFPPFLIAVIPLGLFYSNVMK
jgi:hypothetical protein